MSLLRSSLFSGQCLTADGRTPWAATAFRDKLPSGSVLAVPGGSAPFLVLVLVREDDANFVSAEVDRLAALMRVAVGTLSAARSALCRLTRAASRRIAAPMTKPRVLIAEDETVIRLDLRALLEAAGYDVCGEARDGLEALELARTLEPDVAILDIKRCPVSMDSRPPARSSRAAAADRNLTAFGHNELVRSGKPRPGSSATSSSPLPRTRPSFRDPDRTGTPCELVSTPRSRLASPRASKRAR